MERVQALVASPEPLIQLLARRLASPAGGVDPVLEVLTRRYYRRRSLENLRAFAARRAHLRHRRLRAERRAAAPGRPDGVARRPCPRRCRRWRRSWRRRRTRRTSSSTSTSPGRTGRPTPTSWLPGCGRQLSEIEVLRSVRRVTVTACTPSGDVETLTFRPSSDGAGPGLAEEDVIRGMHPLTAQRLDLWRLKNFDGKRLPSAEDTYLIHVVAKENPNDERLIAMAEVRDATPLTNAAGEVIGFPTVERLLTACIDSLRRARASAGRRPAARPQPDLPVRVAVDRAVAGAAGDARAVGRAADGRRRAWTRSCCSAACRWSRGRSRGTWRCASRTARAPASGCG